MNRDHREGMEGAHESAIPADAVELLRAIRHDIDHVLAPELSSPMAVMIARMASDVLTNIIGREAYLPAIRSDYVEQRRATLEKAVSLAEQLGVGNATLHSETRTILAAAAREPRPTEKMRREVDQALERLVHPLMEVMPHAPDASRASMEKLLRSLVTTMAQFQAKLSAAGEQEKAADLATHDAMRAMVTPERLQAYWRQRYPERPEARVTSLRELAGGFGKTTILFEIEGWEDRPACLVMRRDVLGGATETSVVDEFPVIRTAFKHGLPVPEPLFLETDGAKLDRPFIIVRRVEGVPAGDFWRPSPVCTPETGRDLARALAKLHAIDPAEFGFRSVGSPQDQVKAYLQGWREASRRKQAGPDPVLEMALCWVEQNFPPLPDRLSFVHSDPGFWNILIRDGRITGLLDWELGHLGDPAEDISYVKSSVEVFMPWKDFLDAYREAGGAPYEQERGEFYAIWRDVRNSICSDFAAHAFWSGANPELRMAHCGIVSSKQVLLRGAARIAEFGLDSPRRRQSS